MWHHGARLRQEKDAISSESGVLDMYRWVNRTGLHDQATLCPIQAGVYSPVPSLGDDLLRMRLALVRSLCHWDSAMIYLIMFPLLFSVVLCAYSQLLHFGELGPWQTSM